MVTSSRQEKLKSIFLSWLRVSHNKWLIYKQPFIVLNIYSFLFCDIFFLCLITFLRLFITYKSLPWLICQPSTTPCKQLIVNFQPDFVTLCYILVISWKSIFFKLYFVTSGGGGGSLLIRCGNWAARIKTDSPPVYRISSTLSKWSQFVCWGQYCLNFIFGFHFVRENAL